MFTVTFYSYKGGVGRTLAVANIADRLSSAGKRVFLLDFDLEAPGLDAYFPLAKQNTAGIVEYVTQYSETQIVPDLKDFVTEVRMGESSKVGAIYLMRAGKGDAEYQRLLAHLDWKEFYTQRHGFFFVENLKGAIEAVYSPDYVLVDSRTGLTDIAGICTVQLPNAVVFLSGLNDQNLNGTAKIYKSVIDNKLNKPIDSLLIASPVPELADFAELREQRLAKAKELLGRPIDMVLPLAPFVALQETFVSKQSGSFLAELYGRLTDKIIGLNRFDVVSMLKEARKLRSEGDPEQATSKYKEILEVYPKNPDVWRDYGIFLRSVRENNQALAAFNKAIEHKGKAENFAELALTNLALNRLEAADKAFLTYLSRSRSPQQIATYAALLAQRGRRDTAIAGYTRELELCADDSRAARPLNELANLYMNSKEPEKAVPLYEKALTLMPTNLAINYNLGYAFHLLGRHDQSKPLLTKAVGIYEQTPWHGIPPSVLANMEQAMGNSCAILGQTDKAKAHLSEAIRQASLSSLPTYSSISYEYIDREKFVSETSQLLSRLESLSNLVPSTDS